MIGNRLWITPPMLNALPRDAQIDITCTGCQRAWSQSIRDMVEVQRMGAEFIDLLEMRTRCIEPTCAKRVRFSCTALMQSRPVPQRSAINTAKRQPGTPRVQVQPDLFAAVSMAAQSPSSNATSPMTH